MHAEAVVRSRFPTQNARRGAQRAGAPPRAARAIAVLVAAAALVAGITAAAQPAPAPTRVYAVSDVHGAYDSFVALLKTAKLVDAGLGWIGGDSALVVIGDVLDRGDSARRVVELLMRLETAAKASGGRAQLVLGNHEAMNLTGELGYVPAAEYANYAADESAAERDAAWQRFRAARAQPDVKEDALAAEFARRYPPGFFGQRAAFASNGAIGAWLLRQPVMLVLGDTVFVHGGLPAALSGKTAEAVNAAYGAVLRDYVRAFETLRDAQVLHAEDSFGNRPALVKSYLDAAQSAGTVVPDAIRGAAERLTALTSSDELGSRALYWYRGTVSCSPAVERDRVARALASLGAKRVVVGHTPTPNARALSRFDGSVIRTDTGMQQPGGHSTAVVLENGEAKALYAGETAAVPIERQGRAVGALPAGYDDAAVEDALATAQVGERTKTETGTELVKLQHAGLELEAVFQPAASARRGQVFVPEVAAYRLDRMLGLEIVPVAVLREIDGERGALQVDQSRLTDETKRAADREGADAWCPLADQFALMYLFDSLAYNEGRHPEEIRYTSGNWALALTGNARLFGTSTVLPAYLAGASLELSPTLVAQLRALDAKSIASALGDVLDARRQEALLARRDRLLAPRNGK